MNQKWGNTSNRGKEEAHGTRDKKISSTTQSKEKKRVLSHFPLSVIAGKEPWSSIQTALKDKKNSSVHILHGCGRPATVSSLLDHRWKCRNIEHEKCDFFQTWDTAAIQSLANLRSLLWSSPLMFRIFETSGRAGRYGISPPASKRREDKKASEPACALGRICTDF